MDPAQIGLLITLIILVIMSSYFSSTETAFSVVNSVRLKTLAKKGNKSAAKVLKMLENYDGLLSTILIGNNIVNIASATIATVFFTNLLVSGEQYGAIVSTVVMTIVVLIFGEVVPKTIAKQHSESFALATWPILKFFTIILFPLDIFLLPFKKLVNKLFKNKKTVTVTEDELKAYVQTATEEGGIEEHEGKLIHSAIEFEDRCIRDIMCPRVSVVGVNINDPVETITNKFFETGFSRLPIYCNNIDDIIGVIHQKDFYKLMDKNKSDNIDLSSIVKDVSCLSPSITISSCLREMQKNKSHLAIVVDEFGGTNGIVTLEDIIEELVGEILDEHDKDEVLFKQTGDKTYAVRGSCSIQYLFKKFKFDMSEDINSTTVSGFLSEQTGKIPKVGEIIKYKNLEFKIENATNKFVTDITIKVL